MNESVSVVLRRQVPPREEPPRSWLGGLPMLPEGTQWPRGTNPEKPGEGEVPLHFVAQICCADLPAELWGGLGPRSGWLRLFYNGNSSLPDDRGLWRFVHTEELGSERAPPADIGVIHDGMYTGGSPWTQNNATFPRWPVDLVTVPNQLRHVEGRSFPTPDDFEHHLYPGAPVERDRHKLPSLPPFSRRVLRDGLREVANMLARPYTPRPLNPMLRAGLEEADNRDRLREAMRLRYDDAVANAARRAAEAEGMAELPADRLETLAAETPSLIRLRAEHAEVEAVLAQCPDAEALIALTVRDQNAVAAWRGEVAAWIGEWLETLDDASLDAAPGKADAERIALLRNAPPQVQWLVEASRSRGEEPAHIGLRKVEHSAWTWVNNAWANAARDAMLRYYLDPALKSLLPTEHVSAFEAFWRALYNNRPHRMGGYHDGVQSDAVEGPSRHLLLMQVASDNGMEFCWGDVGALYAFITPQALAAGQFNEAQFILECH